MFLEVIYGRSFIVLSNIVSKFRKILNFDTIFKTQIMEMEKCRIKSISSVIITYNYFSTRKVKILTFVYLLILFCFCTCVVDSIFK